MPHTRLILDFCAHCGVLLPEGLGLEDLPRCDVCDNGVKDRGDRIQGIFSKEDFIKIDNLTSPPVIK